MSKYPPNYGEDYPLRKEYPVSKEYFDKVLIANDIDDPDYHIHSSNTGMDFHDPYNNLTSRLNINYKHYCQSDGYYDLLCWGVNDIEIFFLEKQFINPLNPTEIEKEMFMLEHGFEYPLVSFDEGED